MERKFPKILVYLTMFSSLPEILELILFHRHWKFSKIQT